MSAAPGRSGRVRRIALIVVANILLVILLFAVLEGGASLLFVAHEIATTPAVPEQQHAAYDTLLGWANLPGVHLEDVFGPGEDVRINAQGFRNDGEFATAVPAGRVRVVCSGDSFTFGYGVGNEQAWCEQLTRLDPRLETVNMGLGGYGVDQAYLRYMRDGTKLDHQVQIFAYLTDDFNRMRSDRFMGYGKPLLELRGGSLVVANSPVPRTSWLTRRRALHGETLSRLNMVRLARRLLRLDREPEGAAARREEEDRRLRAVVAHIFADLREVNEAKGSRLVLVHLPGEWDFRGGETTDAWRRFVSGEAARQGIVFIDMVEEIRRIPPTEVASLYGPHHHFTVAGNAWAAEVLYRRLAPLLEVPAADAH